MKNIAISFLFWLIVYSGSSQLDQTTQQNIQKIEEELSIKLNDNEPGAAIIITQGDQILLEKYYGLANLEKQEKLAAQNRMGIASMSKQFTAMAVLILEEEGKLNIHDDIKKYFPDLPIGNRSISIQQLLSHSSGLPELTQSKIFMDSIEKPHTVKQIIEMGFTGEWRSEPGIKYQYCNTGFTIIVQLIEKLSGQSLRDFLEERVFLPLQMNDTYVGDFTHNATDITALYRLDSTGFVIANPMHFSNPIGGGSMVSTASDMSKWAMALINGNHLPKNYHELFEPVPLNNGETYGYGLGMGISDLNGKVFYYHPGMGFGMNSLNLIFPEDKLSITVIRNMEKPPFSSNDIALMAAEILIPKQDTE